MSLHPSTLPGNGAVGAMIDGGRIGSASSSASSRDDRSPKQTSKQPLHLSSISSVTQAVESTLTASQSHMNGASSAATAAVRTASGTPLAVNLKLNAAISTATSPLIENGNGGSGGGPVFMPEKFLSSATASPPNLRKEFDVTKVNGEYRSTNCYYLLKLRKRSQLESTIIYYEWCEHSVHLAFQSK